MSTAREIAEPNTILRCIVGSQLFGVATPESDRDEMGVCIPPPDYVIGLSTFEHWQHHPQPEGERSQPGDIDVTIYSLRKFVALAAGGNPSVLALLFVPPTHQITTTGWGNELQALASSIVARRHGGKFLGYLRAQRDQMLGIRGGAHTNRPELIERYGYDTKFAGHMVRLGYQGIEYLSTGRITLPMPEPERTLIAQIRRGEVSKGDVVDLTADLESQVDALRSTSPLKEHPDYAAINAWLTRAHLTYWTEKGHL